MRTGAKLGMKPCGLGARDTLRLEMCYPLNGSDLSPERNPIEAGLGFFVDLEKPDFIGREKLRGNENERRARTAHRIQDEWKRSAARVRIIRVFNNGARVGEVSSGTLSPSLNIGIGMAYVSAASAKIGDADGSGNSRTKISGDNRKETTLQKTS